LGAPVVAIVLGVAIASSVTLPPVLEPGLRLAWRKVLQAAIVVSGFGLSFATVVQLGISTLPLMLVTIGVALLGSAVLGRAFGLDRMLSTLIGVGTAICGASAIAAIAIVLEPPAAAVAVAIATIFLYNVIAVVIFPPIGHLLGLSQHAFAVWAGTAINDTSSVVAAGYVYGPLAGAEATIVKLTRATLILPIVAVMAAGRARREQTAERALPWTRIVPWFIVEFLGAASLNSLGLVPMSWHPALATIATFGITLALAAIGLQTQIPTLLRAGVRPLALGLCLWVLVAVTALALGTYVP
jgi:uncharacterized integral membrane protein (TIGR00698 family)